ncbi:MAG: peptide chain release factor 1 [Deltaproteobacteria bacterium]|nr:MAG: peptide chain release factor 1 [Deltaproteobacteria bacterium]
MFERLADVEERFVELEAQLADPVIASDHEAVARIHREVVSLREVVDAFRGWKAVQQELEECRALLRDDDPDVREMARTELDRLQDELPEREQALKLLMLPRDPLDDKDILLEIRAGTGGDESSLFAGDLLDMYQRFAAQRGWRVELLSASPGTVGGFKEVIARVSGDRVYSSLKWESGVHRVQRVPATEAQGRIHTSACTVAILPEAEEVDVQVDPGDLRIDTYRASGAGGQHVNRTDSAVRITHLPSGLVVTCQDEKSQHKNKDRALRMLRARLFDLERQRQHDARADDRRAQVGSGDRSERIRTYNFPQNRLTDHRINLTLYKLDRVVAGELDEVVDALHAAHQAEMLQEIEGER